MQNKRLTYVISLLLLLAFLVTGVGNTFGYALCFGDDGHTRVEQASVNGCADCEVEHSAIERSVVGNFSVQVGENARTCSDLLINQDNLIVSKRSVKKDYSPILADDQARFYITPDFHTAQISPALQPLRISQEILAHRTVVLLN